jgi:hypothetical protein
VVRFKSFLYQAASWTMVRRVVAKVEFHCEELYTGVAIGKSKRKSQIKGGERMANEKRDIESRTYLWPNAVSRRQLFKAAGGLGLVLASGVRMSARADASKGTANDCVSPLPIPHVFPPNAGHFFFPGPVTGVVFPATDPTGAHPDGRDPSTITHFRGVIGQADLTFSGTGTNTKTGETGTFNFHTDTRFMKGVFIGADEKEHHGSFAFI